MELKIETCFSSLLLVDSQHSMELHQEQGVLHVLFVTVFFLCIICFFGCLFILYFLFLALFIFLLCTVTCRLCTIYAFLFICSLWGYTRYVFVAFFSFIFLLLGGFGPKSLNELGSSLLLINRHDFFRMSLIVVDNLYTRSAMKHCLCYKNI